MRLSIINKKIDTEISVDDLNILRAGISTAKKYYDKREKQ